MCVCVYFFVKKMIFYVFDKNVNVYLFKAHLLELLELLESFSPYLCNGPIVLGAGSQHHRVGPHHVAVVEEDGGVGGGSGLAGGFLPDAAQQPLVVLRESAAQHHRVSRPFQAEL